MNAWILDKNFKKLQYIDGVYVSFIWTIRYNSTGDFKLIIPVQSNYANNLILGNYLELDSTYSEDSTMIIESRNISSNEKGAQIELSGRSYESVLDRRIVWTKHEYKYNKDNAIYIYNIANTLLTENIISCFNDNKWHGIDENDAKKRIMPIRFDISKLTDKVKNYKIYEDLEFYNDNILSVIETLCKDKKFNLGYKLRRNKIDNFFEFELYKGKDLTRNNSENNKYVMFSPNIGNLPSSSYLESDKIYKNFTRIENNKKTVYYPPTDDERKETGIDRREMNTSPSLSESEESSITDSLLQTKGKQELMDYQKEKIFEGETIDNMFVCNKDYHIGDIVEFENEYGDKDKARIMEIIFSSEIEGDKIYPALESTRNDKEET